MFFSVLQGSLYMRYLQSHSRSKFRRRNRSRQDQQANGAHPSGSPSPSPGGYGDDGDAVNWGPDEGEDDAEGGMAAMNNHPLPMQQLGLLEVEDLV